MKKLIALCLLLATLLSLCACGMSMPVPENQSEVDQADTSKTDDKTEESARPTEKTDPKTEAPTEAETEEEQDVARPTRRPSSKPSGSASSSASTSLSEEPTEAFPEGPSGEISAPTTETPTEPIDGSEPTYPPSGADPSQTPTDDGPGEEEGDDGYEDYQYDEESGLYFALKDGYYTVTSYDERSANLTIPASFNGLPVKAIGDSAFYYCTDLLSVSIPDSVITIGECAFESCYYMQSVTLSQNLQSIGSSAFAYCGSLESIDFPNTLTSIGLRAFSSCYQLKTLSIPASVSRIGVDAFAECDQFESITVEEGNPFYHAVQNCLIESETKTLILSNKDCTIPSDGSVRVLGNYLFSYRQSLLSITIPASIEELGYAAFSDCSYLSSVYFEEGSSLKKIGDHAFAFCYSLETVELPEKVEVIDASAFYSCESLTSFNIPASVVLVGQAAIAGCPKLNSITVEEGNLHYASIGNCLIDLAHNLLLAGCNQSVIPSGGYINTIGDYAFYGLADIESISIPQGVTIIGDNAFGNCMNLETVSLPVTLQKIGDAVFYDCESLTSLEIPASVTAIGDSAFWGCYDLQSITLDPNSILTTIGSYAFAYCESLQSLTIPAAVTEIGEAAFYACSGLQSLAVASDNLRYCMLQNCLIDMAEKTLLLAFEGGSIPTDILIEKINTYAFRGHYDLTSVTIPEGVTHIGDGAFIYCENLTTVYLPSTLLYVEYEAFEYCYAIENVYFSGTEEMWNAITFGSWNDYLLDAAIYCNGSDTPLQPPSDGGGESADPDLGEDTFAFASYYGGLCLTGYYGNNSTVVIPATHEGLPVVAIGYEAFASDYGVQSVTIPASVKLIDRNAFYGCANLSEVIFAEESMLESIGDEAFLYCSALKTITLPDSLKTIGASAFQYSGLTSITFSESLESIGEMAFYACTVLQSLSFPNTLMTIGEYAFYECDSLQSVLMNEGLLSIGAAAFCGCSRLKSVYFSSTVSEIGECAFGYCTALSSITVASANEVYYAKDNCVIDRDSKTLVLGCKDSILPPDGSIEAIGSYAFTGMLNGSVSIPEGVLIIHDYAFYGCTGMFAVALPFSLVSIGYEAFESCDLRTVYYEGTADDWYRNVEIDAGNFYLTDAEFVFNE